MVPCVVHFQDTHRCGCVHGYCLTTVSARYPRYAKAAGVGAASLALALSANAASVKLGADGGALVFDPATITIKAGESVTWTNNVGFPHNVVFDEDAIPVSSARALRGAAGEPVPTRALHASMPQGPGTRCACSCLWRLGSPQGW